MNSQEIRLCLVTQRLSKLVYSGHFSTVTLIVEIDFWVTIVAVQSTNP